MIRSLLADSLTVWKLRGSVTQDDAGVVLRVDGAPAVRVAPGDASRWVVRGEDGPPIACNSIAGALSAVRETLGVCGGPALRIAPARSDA